MKKTKIILACLSALVAAGSSSAFAFDRPGALYVRAADGYYFFASKRNLQNSSSPSFDVGVDITDHWAVQAGAVILNTEVKGTRQTAHGFIYSLDPVYNFNHYGLLEPYVLGGIGVTSLKPAGNNPVNQGNVNLGVGAKYFIHDSIAFSAEARDIYTLKGGKNDVMLTAGITFLLGGNNQPSAYKL